MHCLNRTLIKLSRKLVKLDQLLISRTCRYDSSGNCADTAELTPPPPARLQWELKWDSLKAIEAAVIETEKLIADVDLRIYVHDKYGKGFVKTCRLSPDAYIQMALQLAYYRDAKKFSLTYEASMTRLFREGRTETVRPCTIESSAWVQAMENPKSDLEERIKLLKIACDRHQVLNKTFKLIVRVKSQWPP